MIEYFLDFYKEIIGVLLLITLMFVVPVVVYHKYNEEKYGECINTEYEVVSVDIVDKYYRGMYTTPVAVGKTVTVITHPAEYSITVEYNGIRYVLEDEKTYNQYKDKVGQTTDGILAIRTYEKGEVRYDIVGLGGKFIKL